MTTTATEPTTNQQKCYNWQPHPSAPPRPTQQLIIGNPKPV